MCELFCNLNINIDVTKHRIGRTDTKYMTWISVKCDRCLAYYWFRLRKGTGYDFRAFLTCILLLLLLIQHTISLYLRSVQPVWCFVISCKCIVKFWQILNGNLDVLYYKFWWSCLVLTIVSEDWYSIYLSRNFCNVLFIMLCKL